MQIELRNVSFSYGKQKALDGVSFSADNGTLTAVLGANGAGKSTLFCCMLGLNRNYEGSILLAGQEARSIPRRVFSQLAAYIPQSSAPVYNYSVLDTVLMGTTGQLSLLASPKAEQKRKAEQALETLGILPLAARGLTQLSGGERQLVLVARALVQNAQILIMDEPTANLDYGNQQRVLQGVRSLADSGYTVLISTHNPEHALRYSTHVLALQNGKRAAFGKTADVLTDALVSQLYDFPVTMAEIATASGAVRTFVPNTDCETKENMI